MGMYRGSLAVTLQMYALPFSNHAMMLLSSMLLK